MSAIANSAILVKLSIGTWSASKRNTQLVHEVTKQKDADPRAIRAYDNLMVGSSGHSDIQKHAAQCRLWHTQNTLPWDERGYRLCASSLFLDYKHEHNRLKAIFDDMVNQFKFKYSLYRDTAKDYRGDLFCESDYPPVSEIMTKYSWTFAASPVPESGHLCVDLPNRELEELRTSCDAEVERKIKEAVAENSLRLRKELQHISEKCTETDGDKRWYDSFVDNPLELCRMLKHTNFTNDPQIEEAREKLEKLMVGKNKDQFKESATLRVETKKAVDDMLNKFDW